MADCGANNALDPPLDVDLEVVSSAFEQRPCQGLLIALSIVEINLHRKSPEGLEITITLKQIANPRAADFEHIGFIQQCRRFDCIADWPAEAGTIVETDIFATHTPNLDLHRHRAQMRQHLKICNFKSMLCSRFGGH